MAGGMMHPEVLKLEFKLWVNGDLPPSVLLGIG